MSTENNEQHQATAPPSSVPTLCKNGCGFFGSEATGGCCSKCFLEDLKKKAEKSSSSPTAPTTAAADVCLPVSSPSKTSTSSDKVDVDSSVVDGGNDHVSKISPPSSPAAKPAASAAVSTTAAATAEKTMKKKKKKTSYKSMMASMMKEKKSSATTSSSLDNQGLGGGQFSKIEKI